MAFQPVRLPILKAPNLWMYGYHGCMDGWIEWMDAWMDAWIDAWMDGWMQELLHGWTHG
jgi:hypothetical protein